MNLRPILIIALVCLVGSVVYATTSHRQGTATKSLPSIASVPDFTLTDQNSRVVTLADLRGHPFILDFIFTSCKEFCSDMTEQLAKLRRRLGPDSPIRAVSITVDPEHDTPTNLLAFARAHNGLDPHWSFLTGSRHTIGTILQALFLAPSGDPSRIDTTMHTERLILVDGGGRVRGFYDYQDEDARERLVSDAKALDRTP